MGKPLFKISISLWTVFFLFLGMHPSFEEYLSSKKIDSADLKKARPQLWLEWEQQYEQLNPTTFTDQKLYLINPLRREFPLKTEQEN
ncbi:hypothetical protein [Peijinzhouia sedimentorum]